MPWNEEDYTTVPHKYHDKLANAARAALMLPGSDMNIFFVAVEFSQTIQSVLGPIARELGKDAKWIQQHPITLVYVAKLVDLSFPSGGDGELKKAKPSIVKLLEAWAKQ